MTQHHIYHQNQCPEFTCVIKIWIILEIQIYSPVSTNSLVFDGNNWVMPLDEDGVNPRNICPPRTSPHVPSSKLF